MIYIVMGVAGSGKSTIAKVLARKLKIEFVDADQYHSAANVAKMKGGTPLTDEDRFPWLNSLADAIRGWIEKGESKTLACSALKRSYREILNVDPKNVRFIYLQGSYKLFAERLSRRKKHFMKEKMLLSQFETLEEPTADEAIICDANDSIFELVTHAVKLLHGED